MRALIIDGGHAPSALAATRELGGAGWEVGVGSASGDGFAAASRWCREVHRVPSPVTGMDAFVEGINRAVAEADYEVIFVSGDAEVLALTAARDEIQAVVPFGDYPSVRRSFDKLELVRAAEDAGLSVPTTRAADDRDVGDVEAPIIVKSRFHWEPGSPAATGRLEAQIAPDRDSARAQADRIRWAGGEPLLQHVIDGHLMGFTILTDSSARPVAELQQMAPLTWRPKVGMPARAYTVPVDPDLSDGVRRLLRSLGWFGLVQLQFIVSHEGRPYLIDFNGRAYASERLALAAGINFHDLWGRIATGREWSRPGPARTGLRYQWMEGDIRRCLTGRGLSRGLGLLGCLAYAIGATHPIWARSDPGPLFRYPGDVLRRVRRSRLQGKPVPEPVST